MKSTIKVLHISDIHADESTIDKLTLRIKSFLSDMDQYRGEIDLVVVTGDIALSGKAEQYEVAEKIIIDPMLARLQLSRSKIFFAPGNHDVDRKKISLTEDAGIKQLLSKENDADKYYKERAGFTRLDNYFKFLEQFYSPKVNFAGKVLNINYTPVGVGILNSSWLCAGKDDKESLHLSELQVSDVVSKLDGALLKIGIMHHPSDWFSKYEQKYVIPELKRQFDVVISGHLHENISRGEVTPQYNTIMLTAPSLYNHYCDQFLGYNLYDIDLSKQILTAVYMKYMKLRNTFDRDTEYAQNGEHKFELKTKSPMLFTNSILCQNISLLNSEIEKSLKSQLSLYQHLSDPILVTPRLSSVTWKADQKINTNLKGDPSNFTNGHAFIYAPKDMGKSVLMKSSVAKINQTYFIEKSGPVAAYIDLIFKDCSKSQFSELVREKIADTEPNDALNEVYIFVDHINHKYLNQLAVLKEVSEEFPRWKLIVAIENDFVLESIRRDDKYIDWEFFEVMPWGPSRIREFTVKFFEATEANIDIEAAFNFICHSLRNTDLPSTPVVIALYLSVFPYLEDQVSSISFLHLLEKIEQQRIGSIGGSPQEAFHNKQLILAQFAASCLKNERIFLTKDEASEIVFNFFKEKSLKVDVDKVIKDFISSGLLQKNDDGYEFTLFVFYDYYIARACDKGILKVEDVYNEIHWYINLGQAMALLSGMKRSNYDLVEKIIKDLEPHFEGVEDFDLSKLDEYIHHLLYSPTDDKTPEQIVEHELDKEVDYEEEDKNYDEQKALYKQQRFDIEKLDIKADELQKISVKVLVLKTLYNCFRNLENLKTEEKLVALNHILDLHISCNINMIDFYKKIVGDDDFDSLIAYITTIGGLNFFSKNIGSQSLELIIKKYIDYTQNDFKKLLLILLYGDLRLPRYGQLMEDFVDEISSRAGIEILYHKIRGLITSHNSLTIPKSLVSAFRAAFQKREGTWFASRAGGNVKERFVKVLQDAKKDHLIAYNSESHLKTLKNID
ncbi:MAG: hypothetical protein A2X85_16575 [Geobacteraceae bacterium GWF2_54_21]|nr:MAG: hypothetical protein A2X85_16575 [Geobacteraceae bacterium GWF2_54_21]